MVEKALYKRITTLFDEFFYFLFLILDFYLYLCKLNQSSYSNVEY